MKTVIFENDEHYKSGWGLSLEARTIRDIYMQELMEDEIETIHNYERLDRNLTHFMSLKNMSKLLKRQSILQVNVDMIRNLGEWCLKHRTPNMKEDGHINHGMLDMHQWDWNAWKSPRPETKIKNEQSIKPWNH